MTREGGDGSVVSDYCQRIEAHYSEVWSAPSTRKAWQKGPTYELPDGFCVLSLRRSEDTHAYVTCCMSRPGDELQYKKRHGLEALEAMFDEKQFNCLDFKRPSVV